MDKPETYKILELPPDVYESGQSPHEFYPTLVGVKIDRVIRSEHGLLTYFKNGGKFPIKGWMDDKVMSAVDHFKKHTRSWVKFWGSSPMIYLLPFLFLIPTLPRKMLDSWLDRTYDIADFCFHGRFLYPNDMPKASRELQRVALDMWGRNKRDVYLIKSFCMIFNIEIPYRYPLMDVFQQIRLNEIRKNPAQELDRLIKIFQKRDRRKKWDELKLIPFIIRLSPKIRRETVKFFTMLNLQEFWFDEADLSCFLLNGQKDGPEYDLLGLSRSEREKLKLEIDGKQL